MLMMINKDEILREYVNEVIDLAAGNFECSMEDVGNINEEGFYEAAYQPVLHRESILQVKQLIK